MDIFELTSDLLGNHIGIFLVQYVFILYILFSVKDLFEFISSKNIAFFIMEIYIFLNK